MAIELPDARQLSDEVLGALRLRALRGLELGYTEAEVAELLGLARETVSRWHSAYRRGGLGALPGGRTGRPAGSGRALTDEQGEHICRLIDENAPERLGIPAALWSRRAVRDLIRKELGIRMPVRTAGEYLRRWGYTAKRPARHAREQDPEEVRAWLEQTYPQIRRRAEQEGAVIYFCDETGVEADHHPRLAYSRRGRPAVMAVPDRHIRVNLISAISDDGDLVGMTYFGGMNAGLFVRFLDLLVRQRAGKVFLITDRLSAHDAKAVWRWLAERPDEVEMFLLPRRAPERNPDEYLNNDLKANVHQAGLPHDREELLGRVHSFLRGLLRIPGRILSYFRHPAVQYAAP